MPVIGSSGNIEYIDGFDDYNTSQINRYWSNYTSGVNLIISTSTKRSGNGALSTSALASVILTLANQTTRTIGVALNISTLVGASGSAIISLLDNNTIQLDVRLNSSGTLTVTRNGTTLSTSSNALSAGIWYYIEFSSTINSSTGSYDLHVNGTSWTSGSSVNTSGSGNAYSNQVKLSSAINNGGVYFYFDDLYIRKDGTFMGDQTVFTDFPTGNGATNNFTPLSGSNWQEVSDNPSDDNTSYNYSNSTSQIDLFTFANMPIVAGTIGAVQLSIVGELDASNIVTICGLYRQSTTNYQGSTQYLVFGSYNAFMDIAGNDPSTGTSWTLSGVNSAQYGYEKLT